MLQHVLHQALVQRLRAGEVGPDGPEDPGRPQRLEEALDWGDVDVDQHQRQPQPRGAGGVEKVEALPDGVAGGVPLGQVRGGGRRHEGSRGGDQPRPVQQDLRCGKSSRSHRLRRGSDADARVAPRLSHTSRTSESSTVQGP